MVTCGTVEGYNQAWKFKKNKSTLPEQKSTSMHTFNRAVMENHPHNSGSNI